MMRPFPRFLALSATLLIATELPAESKAPASGEKTAAVATGSWHLQNQTDEGSFTGKHLAP